MSHDLMSHDPQGHGPTGHEGAMRIEDLNFAAQLVVWAGRRWVSDRERWAAVEAEFCGPLGAEAGLALADSLQYLPKYRLPGYRLSAAGDDLTRVQRPFLVGSGQRVDFAYRFDDAPLLSDIGRNARLSLSMLRAQAFGHLATRERTSTGVLHATTVDGRVAFYVPTGDLLRIRNWYFRQRRLELALGASTDVAVARGIRRKVSGFVSGLLGSAAIALVLSGGDTAWAASMVDRGVEHRVADLEAEVRLLKNRIKALEDRRLAVPDKIVLSGNSRVKITLYGQVNRAVRFAFARRDTEINHVDNDISSSRIGVLARGRLFPEVTITALHEVEWQNNRRSRTDDSTEGNTRVRSRKVELWFTHATLGRLHLGHGDAATKNVARQTLSGTDIVFRSPGCGDDGLRFGPPNGSQFPPNGLGMGAACSDLGAGRENRIMYVSPSIQGFHVRVSHGQQDSLDAAIFYRGNPFGLRDIEVAAAFGYRYNSGPGASVPGLGLGRNNVYSGSIGVLHKPSGLNATFAAGTRVSHGNPAGNPKNPDFWYVEGGWQGKIWAIGKTAVAGQFGSYNHVTQDAHAWNAGLAVVQKIDAAAVDLYAGFLYADAKLTGAKLDAVSILIVGARIKF